jgi:hypothetical protein
MRQALRHPTSISSIRAITIDPQGGILFPIVLSVALAFAEGSCLLVARIPLHAALRQALPTYRFQGTK